ncbi:uncharacterized protein P174DRAFT_496474 [Aspergillus novofumigatus IBT 16806]|uniref:RTA1 domain protein n=1 Tax=Aspergillus novofumigatus (strain IBT 16806) TaxID=1392255 RepID=A0A2I1BXL9_ASPN1|nr:uncharacterized protein P174DRAFT_496474 [Aspergillus novofumigatus IBT 16806]PKX90118.1 hypothetical protein P174DRAFT_496474 [Aspergillus novofumigatus IBT 16806]
MSDQHGYGPVVNGTLRPAGLAFVALFGIITLCHFVYSILRLRAWFCIPLILGGISSLYMIKALTAKQLSWLSLRWMTRIYVLVDIACIITQFMGAGMMSSGDASKLAVSRTLILGGLITQFVAVIFFVLMCCHIHMKLRAEVWIGVVRWASVFMAIEAIGLLLLIRTIICAVEYLQGSGGFVVSHVFFIYACDAVPTWLMMALLLVFHPEQIVQQAGSVKGREGPDDTHILLANQSVRTFHWDSGLSPPNTAHQADFFIDAYSHDCDTSDEP